MLVSILLALLLTVGGFAQEGQTGALTPSDSPEMDIPEAQFGVEVQEVIVPVTVTDDKGRFVSDLDADDFRILENGREQEIIYFTRERNQPVVVGFLLDMSNAMRLHWKTFQEASTELVLNLLPGEERFSGYLIGFGNSAELLVNTTSQAGEIVDRIRGMKPGGGAALYDAIYMACTSRDLVKGEPIEPRRILIIIGDGHDNASEKTLEEVLEIAQRNLVTIYAVSTVAFGFTQASEDNLERLAEETGGRIEYPLQGLYSDVSGRLSVPSAGEGNYSYKVGTGQYAAQVASGIFRAVLAVAGEVTTQYILRYLPSAGAASEPYRKIEVLVDLHDVVIRARKGYFTAIP